MDLTEKRESVVQQIQSLDSQVQELQKRTANGVAMIQALQGQLALLDEMLAEKKEEEEDG